MRIDLRKQPEGLELQLPYQGSNGTPKKADTLNADLKKAGIYNALEQKQVTAWLGIRNSAAHGHYSDYNGADVKSFIDGIRNFAAKYPA
jgi:hypothetical protein